MPLLTWANYLEQTNQNNKTTPSGSRHPKFLVKLRIIPQYRHDESFKTAWTAIIRKTGAKSWRKITIEIFRAIWLDRHNAYGNRKTCSRNCPSRVPWFSCQTENGQWNEHGVQMRLTPKDDKAVDTQNLPMPIHPIDSLNFQYLQIWDYHTLTLPKICKSHSCTAKPKREITSLCGSQENQNPDWSWLY